MVYSTTDFATEPTARLKIAISLYLLSSRRTCCPSQRICRCRKIIRSDRPIIFLEVCGVDSLFSPNATQTFFPCASHTSVFEHTLYVTSNCISWMSCSYITVIIIIIISIQQHQQQQQPTGSTLLRQIQYSAVRSAREPAHLLTTRNSYSAR